MIALVDADILVYRFGFASEGDPAEFALARLSEFLDNLILQDGITETWGYLTGKGNFRNELATTAPYKGNRVLAKPYHYQLLREYMERAWGFEVVDGMEADDAIGIEAYRHEPEETIIVSIDKDLNMIRGNHYNFVKEEKYFVTEEEAIRNFYLQILTGDKIDNIIGLQGIGPVKSKKLLADCNTEVEMYEAVLKAYDGDEARVLENARLLWILREEKQVWHPPVK
jgi:5'-3' exonuclease, N-terminal resolvase-like domain